MVTLCRHLAQLNFLIFTQLLNLLQDHLQLFRATARQQCQLAQMQCMCSLLSLVVAVVVVVLIMIVLVVNLLEVVAVQVLMCQTKYLQ
jgi:hypothetical protein